MEKKQGALSLFFLVCPQLIMICYLYNGKLKKHTIMWKEQNNQLVRQFEFDNFIQAFAFMTQVASLAEKQNHHPDWSNVFNKVEIRLSTHDAGGVVTDKDRALARAIDSLQK
jgi:4a-hydroxytetrahydrobiopterin dehydratase